MKILKILSLVLFAAFFALACSKDGDDSDNDDNQNPGPPATGDVIKLETGSQNLTGNLSSGNTLSSLAWAWQSSVACFVTPAAYHYEGNHVLYNTALTTQSVLTVNLIPDDPNSKMALYAYSKGAGNITLPEDLSSCVSCEADPPVGFGSTDTGNRTIELRATTNPYSAMIGVAGATDVTSGGYTLEIILDN